MVIVSCSISSQLKFEVYINDILVYYDYSGTTISVDFPVNQYLQPFKNVIEVKFFETMNLEYVSTNSYHIYLSMPSGMHTILEKEVKIDDNFTHDTLNELSFFKIPEYNIQPPWVVAQTIELNQSLLDKALQTLYIIHDILNNHDILSLMQKLEHRETHLAKSYGRSFEKQMELTRNEFVKLFSNKDLQLWPLNLQTIKPKLTAGGKLLSFQNGKKDPPIIYFNEEEVTCTFFDFHFGIISLDYKNNLQILL